MMYLCVGFITHFYHDPGNFGLAGMLKFFSIFISLSFCLEWRPIRDDGERGLGGGEAWEALAPPTFCEDDILFCFSMRYA